MKTWERERMIREEAERAGEARGKKEGEAIGVIRGKAEAVLFLLRDKGSVGNDIEKKIRSEQNVKVLEDWLRLAAQVNSEEEFEEKM